MGGCMRLGKATGRGQEAGRPQGCAPTILRIVLSGLSIVGAMACPRPEVVGRPGEMEPGDVRPGGASPQALT